MAETVFNDSKMFISEADCYEHQWLQSLGFIFSLVVTCARCATVPATFRFKRRTGLLPVNLVWIDSIRMNRSRSPGGATNIFDNIQRTFSGLNDRLEKNVQEHLRNVYATVAAGVGAAAVGAAIHIFTNILRANFLMAFASIALMFSLISTPHTRENERKRLGYFFLFCGISGISMGPLLERVIEIDPSCVLTALLATATVFGCFSLVALHAPSTKYIHMGGTLASAALCLLFASFFASYYVIIIGGLALSCAFVVYDTQLIAEKSRRGDDDYIWHSVELFIDFANIFRYLVVLLADKKERDNRKRRN